MYCNQCGQPLPPTSRFCNACGAAVAAGGNVNVARENFVPPVAAGHAPFAAARRDDLAPNESVIFTLRPTLIFVFVRYIIATLILLATAALMGLMHSAKPEWFTGFVSFVAIFVVGVIAFATPIYKHLLRRREVYTLTNHKLEMRYGLLSKTVRNIPLTKIQDVTVSASFWQRLISIGDIEIDSASEMGKIILDDIHHPERYANLILDELRRRN
ncbi:MAG TPA: PH domain-containing protein [Blastocatellia bacterium]|nr:PH domain-containing protein [Blastocatellia bacterium]